MSIDLQKQIKDNSTDIQEYFKELSQWTGSMKNINNESMSLRTSDEYNNIDNRDDNISKVISYDEDGEEESFKIDNNEKDTKTYYGACQQQQQQQHGSVINSDDKEGKEVINENNNNRKGALSPESIANSDISKRQLVNIRKITKERKNIIDYVIEARERGNDYYKKGQHKAALNEYRNGLTYVIDNNESNDNMDYKDLPIVVLYNNISAVECVLSNYTEAVKSANEAIKLCGTINEYLIANTNDDNDCCSLRSVNIITAKSYYRRAYALSKMKRWKLAQKDLQKSLELMMMIISDDTSKLETYNNYMELKKFIDRQVEGQNIIEREQAIKIITNTQREVNEDKLIKIFVNDDDETESIMINNKIDNKTRTMMEDDGNKINKEKKDSVKKKEYIPKALRIREAIKKGKSNINGALGKYYL